MYVAFPRSEYYQRVRLPPQHLHPYGWSFQFAYSACAKTTMDLPGSSMLPFPFVPCSQTPPRSPATIAICRLPTIAFQVFDLVGPRSCNEALSLHLRYGPNVALSTLSTCRYLHAPKTRFLVSWLGSFQGRELHPLKAPGFSWRTGIAYKISNSYQLAHKMDFHEKVLRTRCGRRNDHFLR